MAGSTNVSDLNLVIKGVDDIKGSMYIAVFDNAGIVPGFWQTIGGKGLACRCKDAQLYL